MIDSFNFSSLGRPDADAFRDYVDLYRHGADVTRGRGSFHAEVRAWRLDGVLLFERRVSGVVHARQTRVQSDAFQHIVLTLVLEGRVEGSLESGFSEALPGEILLADMLRATRTELIDAHVITASIDRSIIEAGLGAAGGLHGVILRPPSNLVLVDFIRSLVARSDTLSPGALAPLSRALVDILASVDAFDSRASSDTRRHEFIRREIVERHIGVHLRDRGLSVETISEATGISRSALYRLFDSQGGVARLIQKRRVDALRSLLDAQAAAGSNVLPQDLAVRVGFGSDDQARRLFTEACGTDPKAYLDALTAMGPDSGGASAKRWAGWMTEVS
ncbi:hypothetical protein BH10PSE2_BH10PSE2_17910 [soil metagenome]